MSDQEEVTAGLSMIDLLIDTVWSKSVGVCIGTNKQTCGREFISRYRFEENIVPLLQELSAAKETIARFDFEVVPALDAARETIVKQQSRMEEYRTALLQFMDQNGFPPEDTGEWREVERVLGSVDDSAALNAAKKEAQQAALGAAITVCNRMCETNPRKQYQEAAAWLADKFTSMHAELDKKP